MVRLQRRGTSLSLQPLDYDSAAAQFDRRYRVYAYPGIAVVLRTLAHLPGVEKVLEVGCGTGHWLALLADEGLRIHGLDRSQGMLGFAQRRPATFDLVRGRAGRLPYRRRTFDLICCVNALHQFSDPERFIRQTKACLRRGGRLALVGLDPSDRRNRWFLYDYFKGTLEADRARYPSVPSISNWMAAAGFEAIENRTAEHIQHDLIGETVFDEPLLGKQATSQLMLLSEAAYAAGWSRIEADVKSAAMAGETIIFPTNLRLVLVTGIAS